MTALQLKDGNPLPVTSGQYLIMTVSDGDGVTRPIYGDAFAASALTDVLEKLKDLEAALAKQEGYDA